MAPRRGIRSELKFDPEGSGYDYRSAREAGMGPDSKSGHWGTVAETKDVGVPEHSYKVLKGRKHKSWKLGVLGEKKRGYGVVKIGDRYYSVPQRGKGR